MCSRVRHSYNELVLSHSFVYVLKPFFSAGDLKVEEEVLQWLITQKTEDRIELITRMMLEMSVEETQYLAVYFCMVQYSFIVVISFSFSAMNNVIALQINKTVTYATKFWRAWKRSTTSATCLVFTW